MHDISRNRGEEVNHRGTFRKANSPKKWFTKYHHKTTNYEGERTPNEEPAKLNRGAASVVTNEILYFLRFLSQNNPLVLHGRILSKLIPSCIKRKVLNISSVFHMKSLQDAGIDNVFFWINPVEK
jgi:hypothetical protein